MGWIKKLRLVSSGTDDNRVYFIIEKSNLFFELFPLFLISCGFRNIGVFDDYLIVKPDIYRICNKIDRFISSEEDIDLIYTIDKIVVIVRTSEDKREIIVDKFRRIAEF